MSSIPEGLHYTKEHEWVSSTGNLYTMGITDFAQAALGDIVYVQLPKVGESITAGKHRKTSGRKALNHGGRVGPLTAAVFGTGNNGAVLVEQFFNEFH